jgi:hypothetical protein
MAQSLQFGFEKYEVRKRSEDQVLKHKSRRKGSQGVFPDRKTL